MAVSGRSRLHLLDLGSCETDISRTREGGGGQCLSLSALGNVILALANGAKHVPYRYGHFDELNGVKGHSSQTTDGPMIPVRGVGVKL